MPGLALYLPGVGDRAPGDGHFWIPFSLARFRIRSGWGRRLEGRMANELRDAEIPLNGIYS